MAKTAQNLLTNKFNSLPTSAGKSAMSLLMQEWVCEPLIDAELEEWLLNGQCGDSSLKANEPESPNTSSEMLQDLNDFGLPEDNYWLEEFPLFEEVQPLNDIKVQSKSSQHDEEEEEEMVTELRPTSNLSLSIENATLVVSDDRFLLIEGTGETQWSEGEKKWEEMDDVEEIIRNAAMELDPWESETSGSEASSEGLTTLGSSGNSGAEEEEEEEEDESDDFEERPRSRKAGRSGGRVKSSVRVSRKGESIEDKRLRKKEQNKFAATRYRLKKKAEVSELLRKEEELKEKRARLEEKVDDLGNEIRCLKGLMRDFFKAKGLL